MSDAPVTETQNHDGSTTLSMKLSEMSVEQLVQVSQAVGRQIDSLREQRLHLKVLIDAKVEAQRKYGIRAKMAELQAELDGAPGVVNGEAPGAVIVVEASAHKAKG